jgi:hypothetical protein
MNKDNLIAVFIVWVLTMGLTYLFFAFTSMSWDYLGGDNQFGRFMFGGFGVISGISFLGAALD